MFSNLSDEQIRSICRTNLEALEKWARILLHYVLTDLYGKDYIHTKNADGNYKFRKALVEKTEQMMKDEPGRFPTPLDTLFLDELIYFICNDNVYAQLSSSFQDPDFYPQGKESLRTYLSRLIPIRNKLSHTNPFSYREAQRAVCYSNDFIDAAKQYFEKKSMTKDFNVPSILKISDSFGNESIPSNNPHVAIHNITVPGSKELKSLHMGEQFSVSLEMDPSFPDTEYQIKWHKTEGVDIQDNGKKIVVTIGYNLIGEKVSLIGSVISNNEWHRFGKYDQLITIDFKAVPIPAV